MTIISRPLYIYLQRPDTGEWVTAGCYKLGAAGEGMFRYAPSYLDTGLAWSLDPVNLPMRPATDVIALRYQGLHYVLRDTLFGRMVFNAVCGNDDDHVRNHAIVYCAEERRWRIAPAFDVVPNPVETPTRLHMQLSMGRFDISRDAVLADAHRFGFADAAEAGRYLILERITAGFDDVAHWLDREWRQVLHERLSRNVAILRDRPGA